jgi:hypothetical protein
MFPFLHVALAIGVQMVLKVVLSTPNTEIFPVLGKAGIGRWDRNC